jgi:hypothetical protein
MKRLILPIVILFISWTLIAQPANDDPCAAVLIPVGTPDYLGQACEPATTYAWSAATLTTATPNPSCAASGFSNIRDVWYKMAVPASGKIKFTTSSAYQLIFVFYKQANCSNTLGFAEVGCFNYTTVNITQSFDLSSLNAGTTIYLRAMRALASAQANGSAKICALETIAAVAIDYNKRVGIGTNQPLANLDIVGKTIIRDSLSIGKTLEVRENLTVKKDLNINGTTYLNGTLNIVGNVDVGGSITTTAMQVTSGAGINKMMVSDNAGNGSWVTRDSIFSSSWVTSPYNSRDTVVDGTCLRVRHIDALEITSYILSNKLITVYFRVGSIGPYQLPYTSDAGGATNTINCIFQVGKILLYRHTYNTCRFNSGIAESYPGQPVLVNLPQSLEYRYVIHN